MGSSSFSISSSNNTSMSLPNLHGQKRAVPSMRISALIRRGEDDDRRPRRGSGRIVDEGMVVLRKRIQEIKRFEERSYEAPSEWMDWERILYEEYNSLVFEIVGFVQTQLMNSRPGLALGFLALITVSVASSSATMLVRVLETVRWVSSALHVI